MEFEFQNLDLKSYPRHFELIRENHFEKGVKLSSQITFYFKGMHGKHFP